MARNELTSKRISTIAGRVLEEVDNLGPVAYSSVYYRNANGDLMSICGVSAQDIKALAASALTQTADKPKRKRTKNVKKRSK